ncbi:MAG: alpha/beta fold hydrolase [Cryobacterium sp.]|nr:alpha/beta fold hydrolase [Cryobacterium sp.]
MSHSPFGVSADLSAGQQQLRDEIITDLADADDIDRYREIIASRAALPTDIARRYAMDCTELTIGEDVPVTRFSRHASPSNEASATLVFLHGGGLVGGNRFDGIDVVLEASAGEQVEVWTVEYGLAPETPFDYAIEQCWSVLNSAFATSTGPVILAGQSAGGGLAAATALLDRDRTGGRLAGQLLVCPMLDNHSESESMRQVDSDPAWSRQSNITAWAAAGVGQGDRQKAPGTRDDLGGLPSTFLDAGSAEVFRDEIVDFATRLWTAGVQTELHVWAGGFHGFDGVVPDAEVSRAAKSARNVWLHRVLRGDFCRAKVRS